MDFNELENYRLTDAVKFHSRLNPRLWGTDEHLLPEVRDQLLKIADDFREFLGIDDLEIQDITVSGSNAAYTYTDSSDIDLHLVVDLPRADASEVYRELFDAKKYQYNDQHDFTVRGHEVELYVQNANETHVSQGIYSVMNNDWVRVPSRKKPSIDDISVESKYQDLAQRIKQAVANGDRDQLDALSKKISHMRKTGLAKTGEFGTENLVFKLLRKHKDLDRLRQARQLAKNQEMSLDERKKQKKKVSWGRFGSLWYPGYNNIGQSSNDAVTPADLGMESVTESVDTDIATMIHKFADFCIEQLSISNSPRIKIKKDPAWSRRTGTFGRYDPDNNMIELSTADRHPVDVLRTLAHELVHFGQNEKEPLPPGAGATGSAWEDEANAIAGRVMRDFAKQHSRYFDQVKNTVSESSGYIPVTDAEARDPRYSMAITKDVRPGEPRRQAAKLGFKTDKAGRPPTARTNGLIESLTQRLQTIKESRETLDEQELEEVAMSPGALQQFTKSDAANGMLAGFEAELIFPGLGGVDEDDLEMEPDYDEDRRASSISDIIDFFTEGPYADMTRGQVLTLQEALQEQFIEWEGDQIAAAWDNEGVEVVEQYIKDNDEFDRDDAEEQAQEELGSDASSAEINRRVNDMFDEFVTQVIDEGFDNRIYSDAREQYEEDMRDQFDEYAWLDDQDLTMAEVANEYNLSWPYMTTTGDEEGFNAENAQRLADDLAATLGVTTVASSGYHSTRRDNERWIFEPDSSLDPDDSDDLAIEIVSPPMPLSEAVELLPGFFAWAAEQGAYANRSTGFHMSVSMPDHEDQQLDYTKLAVMLGDQYVLKQFGRTANFYTASAVDKIQDRLSPENVSQVLGTMRNQLNQIASTALAAPSGFGKYTSINPKGKYIEFRSAGGSDYINDIPRIQNTLMRYARATALAMDPEAEKQEYAKKLYKLLGRTETEQVTDPRTGRQRVQVKPTQQGLDTDVVWMFSRYTAGELTKNELVNFLKQVQSSRKSQSDKQAQDKDQEQTPGIDYRHQLPPERPNGNFEIYDRGDQSSVYRFAASDNNDALRVLGLYRARFSNVSDFDAGNFGVRPVSSASSSIDAGDMIPYQVIFSIGNNPRKIYRLNARSAGDAISIFMVKARDANYDMEQLDIHGVERL